MPKGCYIRKQRTHDDFIKELELKNKKAYDELEFKTEYKNPKTHLLVITKYGECRVLPSVLIKGSYPTIQSAIDKDSYFSNLAIAIHGETYDYSKTEYINSKTKVCIICSKHGEFYQYPSNHISGKNGCPFCAKEKSNRLKLSNWLLLKNESYRFDSYKLYKIKCWDDNEIFYKIGITSIKLNERFDSIGRMPYNYEIIEIIESEDGEYIWRMEKLLHKKK